MRKRLAYCINIFDLEDIQCDRMIYQKLIMTKTLLVDFYRAIRNNDCYIHCLILSSNLESLHFSSNNQFHQSIFLLIRISVSPLFSSQILYFILFYFFFVLNRLTLLLFCVTFLLCESNIKREYVYTLFIVTTAQKKKIEEYVCIRDALMTIRCAYVCVCLCEYT
jgi:hypothetical protein